MKSWGSGDIAFLDAEVTIFRKEGGPLEIKDLTGLYYTKIVKSLKNLEYSYQRTLSTRLNLSQMTDSQLEAWDSFAARFARTSDIFLSKYIPAVIEPEQRPNNDDWVAAISLA